MIIEIDKYIRKVRISKSQRPKYFEWNGHTIKAKGKYIFKKYIKPECMISSNNGKSVKPCHLKNEYCIYRFQGDDCLGYFSDDNNYYTLNTIVSKSNLKRSIVDVLCIRNTREKIIANPTQVGKPNYAIITGQDLYSQNYNEFTRNKIMDRIKESFVPYLKNIEPFRAEQYPIRCRLYIFDTVKSMYDNTKDGSGRRWDIINRGYPYSKAMMDLITTGIAGENKITPLLYDDDRLHLIEDGGSVFIPIEDSNDRKLVFVLFSGRDEYPTKEIKIFEDLRQQKINNSEHYSAINFKKELPNNKKGELW